MWNALIGQLRHADRESRDAKSAGRAFVDGEAEAPLLVRDATLSLLAGDDAARVSRTLRAAADGAIEHGLAASTLVLAATAATRAVWESLGRCDASSDDLRFAGARTVKALEILGSTLADAFAHARLETTTARAEARQAFLDELLAAPPRHRAEALRRRRRAQRHGLPVDGPLRLVLASPGRGARDDELEAMIIAVRRATNAPPPGPGTEFRLPQISEWHGRLVALESGMNGATGTLREAFERGLASFPRKWVAIAGGEARGPDRLAASMEHLSEALRTAELVGRFGWIPAADELNLETLLSLDEDLRRQAIEAELGPIVRDARLGPEMIATLEAWFAAGQNASKAARVLHVAPRTVAYRLTRARHLLPHAAGSESLLRLAVALFAFRLDHRTLDGSHHRPSGNSASRPRAPRLRSSGRSDLASGRPL